MGKILVLLALAGALSPALLENIERGGPTPQAPRVAPPVAAPVRAAADPFERFKAQAGAYDDFCQAPAAASAFIDARDQRVLAMAPPHGPRSGPGGLTARVYGISAASQTLAEAGYAPTPGLAVCHVSVQMVDGNKVSGSFYVEGKAVERYRASGARPRSGEAWFTSDAASASGRPDYPYVPYPPVYRAVRSPGR